MVTATDVPHTQSISEGSGGRMGLEAGAQWVWTQCGTDTDKSLKISEATVHGKGAQDVTLRFATQQAGEGGREWMG